MSDNPTTANEPPLVVFFGNRIRVKYRNWRGLVSIRHIEIGGPLFWGSTEHHPEPQWLVMGWDMKKKKSACRVWAIKDMWPVEPGKEQSE